MSMPAVKSMSVADAAEAAASALVRVRNWGGSSFINLPLVYPGGAFVTVKLDRVTAGGVRVSDNGFAFRELESVGLQRSFANTANSIAEVEGLDVNRRAVFVDVPDEQLARAICDVGIASWQIADRVLGRAADEAEAEIEDYLRERLIVVFGSEYVKVGEKITGASRSDWDVSAVIQFPNRTAVFHAVSNHANAVYRTSAAFHDLAALEHPPSLVSVVKSKAALGTKFGVLAQAGRVIEDEQPDEVYLKAAA